MTSLAHRTTTCIHGPRELVTRRLRAAHTKRLGLQIELGSNISELHLPARTSARRTSPCANRHSLEPAFALPREEVRRIRRGKSDQPFLASRALAATCKYCLQVRFVCSFRHLCLLAQLNSSEATIKFYLVVPPKQRSADHSHPAGKGSDEPTPIQSR